MPKTNDDNFLQYENALDSTGFVGDALLAKLFGAIGLDDVLIGVVSSQLSCFCCILNKPLYFVSRFADRRNKAAKERKSESTAAKIPRMV